MSHLEGHGGVTRSHDDSVDRPAVSGVRPPTRRSAPIRLSQIGVDTIYAAAIAKVVCKQLTLPDLTIFHRRSGLDFLAKEGPFDEETVEAIIDVADDARYEEEKEGIGARIVFDGPLTHDGICIQVDLLVHELAHHVEWHGIRRRLEGHLEAFGDAVPVVTEAVWQLLHLDRWTEQQWLEIAPKVPQPTVDDASTYRLRHGIHKAKWQLLLNSPWN